MNTYITLINSSHLVSVFYLQEDVSVSTTQREISVRNVSPVTMVTPKMALNMTASPVHVLMEVPVFNFIMEMLYVQPVMMAMGVSKLV